MDIILADDHALVREGLKPFLEELGGGARVIEADSFGAALGAAKTAPALGLVLLDLAMPGMDGLSGVRLMIADNPDVPVVILSGTHDQALILKAFDSGIAGFIPKSTGSEVMMSALNLVLSGERYLPSQILLGAIPQPASPQPTARAHPAPAAADAARINNADILERLSNRERTVLELLVGGMTNKEIARSIDLQEATVKIHVKNIYRKMGVANRAQAVRTAIQPDWGLGVTSGAIN